MDLKEPDLTELDLKEPDLKEPVLKQPSPWETIGLGTLAAVVGFYLVLAALSLLPSPGRPNGPMWVVLAVGFCLLLSGLWRLIPALVMDEHSADGTASTNTPQRLHVAQYVFALAVVMCCAMVGSWIALGPGTTEACHSPRAIASTCSDASFSPWARSSYGSG
jgi:hypothetical protein